MKFTIFLHNFRIKFFYVCLILPIIIINNCISYYYIIILHIYLIYLDFHYCSNNCNFLIILQIYLNTRYKLNFIIYPCLFLNLLNQIFFFIISLAINLIHYCYCYYYSIIKYDWTFICIIIFFNWSSTYITFH